MKTILIAVVALTALVGNVSAQEAQTHDKWGNNIGPKQVRLADCRSEWKGRAVGESKWKEQKGQPAYAAFLKACIASKPIKG